MTVAQQSSVGFKGCFVVRQICFADANLLGSLWDT